MRGVSNFINILIVLTFVTVFVIESESALMFYYAARQDGWYSLCSDRFALEHFVLTVLSRHNLHWCQICIDHHFVLAYNVLAIFELWHILF